MTTHTPPAMRRYFWRLGGFMLAYMGTLVGALTLARAQPGLPVGALAGLAVATALPICGMFWAIFRLLVETDDEYQRLLFAKQTLWATALTLVIVTLWQFLAVFGVVDQGPQWMAAIWFAMLGIGGAIVRWRA